jgi:2-amino-4-hydroxy-6-hydroxymethyldihydropteridine diphosphokinase
MPDVLLLLGSNIDKERNLRAAVRLLGRAVEIVALSAVYETTPVGLHGQPDFLNAAALIRTDLTAAALKDGPLATIEHRLGRARTADKNAPRTIDLDIALYDNMVGEYTPADGRPRRIPSPDLLQFAHAARPAADLLPATLHPITGEALNEIASRLVRAAQEAHGDVIRLRPDIDLWAVGKES